MSKTKDNSTKFERDKARFLYLRKRNARYYKLMCERFSNFEFKEHVYNEILNKEPTRENVKEELIRDKVSKMIVKDAMFKIDKSSINAIVGRDKYE
jgi:hypothetical protein